MVETIISLAAIQASSNVFYSWTQEGYKDSTLPGSLQFTSHDGLLSMYIYFGVAMAFSTAKQMYTSLTRTLFELFAKDVSFPNHPLPHVARIPSSSPQPRPDRLSPRSGRYNLIPLVKISWISSHAMSRVTCQNLTTIRSIASTLKNRPTSESNRLRNRGNVS
jgi:hypothetical protein